MNCSSYLTLIEVALRFRENVAIFRNKIKELRLFAAILQSYSFFGVIILFYSTFQHLTSKKGFAVFRDFDDKPLFPLKKGTPNDRNVGLNKIMSNKLYELK